MSALPFTIFHFGPALCFGLPLRKHIHAPTFILANVIVDFEPLLVLIFGLRYPLHGYLHTFLIAGFFGSFIGYLMFLLEKLLYKVFKKLFLEEEMTSKLKPFIIAGVSGTIFHVLLDSPLYSDIKPFYPVMVNPLYSPQLASDIYGFCFWTGILGIAFYLYVVFSEIKGKAC